MDTEHRTASEVLLSLVVWAVILVVGWWALGVVGRWESSRCVDKDEYGQCWDDGTDMLP